MTSDHDHVDREWNDERAVCAICGTPAVIRLRTFPMAGQAKYMSARCTRNTEHDMTAGTHTFLKQLRRAAVS